MIFALATFLIYRKHKRDRQAKEQTKETQRLKEEVHNQQEENAQLKMEKEQSDKESDKRDEQYRILFNMRQQSVNDGVPKELLEMLHEASDKGLQITSEQQSRVFEVVNSVYPLFAQKMLKDRKRFSEKQFLICYLMRLGLSKNDIHNLTNVSRSTIWRCFRTFSWAKP